MKSTNGRVIRGRLPFIPRRGALIRQRFTLSPKLYIVTLLLRELGICLPHPSIWYMLIGCDMKKNIQENTYSNAHGFLAKNMCFVAREDYAIDSAGRYLY
jgi:hypothetical protein